MLNFYVVQKRFEEQIYDILKYEITYYDNDEIILQNFVDRFKEYLDLFYSKYKVEWGVTKSSFGAILVKIQFDEDPPFGFEFCIDLDMLKQTNFSI